MKFDWLNNLCIKKEKEIIEWLHTKQKHVRMPIFTSIDLRNAGFKIAHVDANLFPAGFNNLSLEARRLATQELTVVLKTYGDPKKVIIFPENFSRNLKYFENICTLREILEKAGLDCVIGSPFIEEEEGICMERDIVIKPLIRINNRLQTKEGFVADIIILNNDLTTGVPEALMGITQQILPSVEFGWYKRRKSRHFEEYSKLAQEFAQEFSFDPWLITPYTMQCDEVNFKKRIGFERLAELVDKQILAIREKYNEYNVKQDPFVYIKADRGTYGMGIISLSSGGQLLELNKKHRHSMDKIKSGVQNTEVIIQEGIPTVETFEGMSSESLIYSINGNIIGFINRANDEKDATENLNSKGMKFYSTAYEDFNIKHVVSKLACLASANESK
jgi:glutamate--cysteine ligase